MAPTELRIKLAHIGMEPNVIRKHERRIKARIARAKARGVNDHSTSYLELHKINHHRRWVVRNEARATHLACAFIRGTPYSSVELKCEIGKRDRYISSKVLGMVSRYADDEFINSVTDNGGLTLADALKNWYTS